MTATAASNDPPRNQGRTIAAVQLARLGLRLASAALLARLLTPHDYGLHGMAAAIFGLLYMARDFGIGTSIQQSELSRERFNAYCRLGALGGIGLAAFGALLGPLAGWFYHEPKQVPLVLMTMCTAFIFSGFAAPPLGLLYREQKAGIVALIELSAMFVSSVAAAIAAWGGWGVWALVLMAVVNEFTLCFAAWMQCSWPVGFRAGSVDWRALLQFSAHFTGYNMANYWTRILDQVVVGRAAGAHALGLYGRGAQITALPLQFGLGPFGPWIVATLSRRRDSPHEFSSCFQSTLNGLLHVSLACGVLCIALPELVVMVVFGHQWLDAAPVVRWLGVTLAMQPFLIGPAWLLASITQSRPLLAWGTIGVVLTAVACLAASRWGFVAVAQGAATAALAQGFLAPWICRHYSKVRTAIWLEAATVPLFLHGSAGILATVGENWLAISDRPSVHLFGTAGLLGLYYLGAFCLSKRVRSELKNHIFWKR